MKSQNSNAPHATSQQRRTLGPSFVPRTTQVPSRRTVVAAARSRWHDLGPHHAESSFTAPADLGVTAASSGQPSRMFGRGSLVSYPTSVPQQPAASTPPPPPPVPPPPPLPPTTWWERFQAWPKPPTAPLSANISTAQQRAQLTPLQLQRQQQRLQQGHYQGNRGVGSIVNSNRSWPESRVAGSVPGNRVGWDDRSGMSMSVQQRQRQQAQRYRALWENFSSDDPDGQDVNDVTTASGNKHAELLDKQDSWSRIWGVRLQQSSHVMDGSVIDPSIPPDPNQMTSAEYQREFARWFEWRRVNRQREREAQPDNEVSMIAAGYAAVAVIVVVLGIFTN